MDVRRVGTTRSDIRAQNMSAILLALLHGEGLSRVALAQQVGVSTTTITNLITELTAQGLVEEEGVIKPSDSKASVGRPQVALQLVPNTRYAIGVHIGVGVVRIGLTNLFGEVQDSIEYHHDPLTPYQAVLESITDATNQLLSDVSVDEVVGVGVGASGLVDAIEGVNVIAPNLDWHHVPIQDDLRQALRLPVTIENNVRTMALGEAFFGAAQHVNALAFVYSRIGVGAGFVMNGQLYRGATAGAGEIGHNIILLDDDTECSAENTLEALIAEPQIIAAAERIRERFPNGIFAKSLHRYPMSISTILDAALSGDDVVRTMLQTRARYFGISLANLVNVFNPELIVVGGMFSHEWLLDVIKQTVQHCAFAGLGRHVTVQSATFGEDAGVIGAASLALDKFFYRQGV